MCEDHSRVALMLDTLSITIMVAGAVDAAQLWCSHAPENFIPPGVRRSNGGP
jgi:hypothetical protein